MMKRIVSLLFFVCFLMLAPTVSAQEDWVIDAFTSDLTIAPDGTVRVVEQIDVGFLVEKHGIYRDIPVVYTNDDGSKVYTQIAVAYVTQDGREATYETHESGDYIEIKIGDADYTITGDHAYTIEYTATGILRAFPNHDELYWNVTGNDWGVPIRRAFASVTLPMSGINEFNCYQGAYGSGDYCRSEADVAKTRVGFESLRQFEPGEGMTIVVGFTKGLVPILTVAPPKTFVQQLLVPKVVFSFAGTVVLTLLIVPWLWWKNGRDFWYKVAHPFDTKSVKEIKPLGAHETIVVEFEPPEKLCPAEIGVLMDERADTLDVTATIIDLASRGFLTITEEEKKWLFGSHDYLLTNKKKGGAELLPYERELLERIFDDKEEIRISALKRKFYSDLAKVKEQLYIDVVGKKFFPKNPERVRGIYGFTGLFLTIAGISIATVSFSFPSLILPFHALGAGLAIGGGLLLLFSRSMPRRTALGRELYRRSQGFELFLAQAEKYRQRFFEKENLFNEILPYAIVFGLTDKFAKALKDMGITATQPSWYRGTGTFNTSHFTSSMASFSNSFSSAIAAAPKSSGLSSGGGSSGGGFGGGGGGSW